MYQKMFIVAVLLVFLCFVPTGFCTETTIPDGSSFISSGNGEQIEAHVTATADSASAVVKIYTSGSAEKGSFSAEASGSATASNGYGTVSASGLVQSFGKPPLDGPGIAGVTAIASFSDDPPEVLSEIFPLMANVYTGILPAMVTGGFAAKPWGGVVGDFYMQGGMEAILQAIGGSRLLPDFFAIGNTLGFIPVQKPGSVLGLFTQKEFGFVLRHTKGIMSLPPVSMNLP
jgi:hypothetical protein